MSDFLLYIPLHNLVSRPVKITDLTYKEHKTHRTFMKQWQFSKKLKRNAKWTHDKKKRRFLYYYFKDMKLCVLKNGIWKLNDINSCRLETKLSPNGKKWGKYKVSLAKRLIFMRRSTRLHQLFFRAFHWQKSR